MSALNFDTLDTADARHEAAGNYVLGTLSAASRRAVEQRLPHDAPLQIGREHV